MVFSIIVGALVFGSGFVILSAAPTLWWMSFIIGAGGSFLFARWYSGRTPISFFAVFATSFVFIVNAYLYTLLLNRSHIFWYALGCLAILLRWHTLWYRYLFDQERYPLLSIPHMSVWFMAVSVALGCANMWGYQLYFGYSHTFSLIGCSLLFGLCGWLTFLVLKFDVSRYRIALLLELMMAAELLFVGSFLSFVPMVRALIAATFFFVFIILARTLARETDRGPRELIRASIFACCSIASVLLLIVVL